MKPNNNKKNYSIRWYVLFLFELFNTVKCREKKNNEFQVFFLGFEFNRTTKKNQHTIYTRKHREKIYCVDGQFFRILLLRLCAVYLQMKNNSLSLTLWLLSKQPYAIFFCVYSFFFVAQNGRKKNYQINSHSINVLWKMRKTSMKFPIQMGFSKRTIPIYFVVIVWGNFESPINQWS